MVLHKSGHGRQRRRRESGQRPRVLDQFDQHRESARPTTRTSTTPSRRTRRSSRGRSRSSRARAAIAGPKTDPADADQAEHDGTRACASASARAPGRVGVGGVLANGDSFEVRFRVVVNAGTPDGTQILNTAILSSKDEDGIDYTSVASAPAAVIVHGVPDVTIVKAHTGAFVRGQQGTFSLIAGNTGGRPTRPGRDRRRAAGRSRRRGRERRRLDLRRRHRPSTRCTASAATRSRRAPPSRR